MKGKLDIRPTNETLDYILAHRCSVSRFGDGEFNIIKGGGNDFCNYDPFLAEKLKEVLTTDAPNHIIGLPHGLISQDNYTLRVRVFWISYFCKTFDYFIKYLKPGKVYYDAGFTRFYWPYKNKSGCHEYVQKLKQLWEKQDILLIEGEYSRLGVNNDLFDNASSIERILGPTKNAYTKYQEILNAAAVHGKSKLILIALGQTATALAYDMAKQGLWAIDIGHIDIEYEWFLRKAKHKIKIEGKHVNEAHDYVPTEVIFDNEQYEKQIIAKIL